MTFSTWRYGVIATPQPDGSFYFACHEIYMDGDGKPHSWTTEPVDFGSDGDPEDVRLSLANALVDCLRSPILRVEGDKLVEWRESMRSERAGDS